MFQNYYGTPRKKTSKKKDLHWQWGHVARDTRSLRPHTFIVLAQIKQPH